MNVSKLASLLRWGVIANCDSQWASECKQQRFANCQHLAITLDEVSRQRISTRTRHTATGCKRLGGTCCARRAPHCNNRNQLQPPPECEQVAAVGDNIAGHHLGGGRSGGRLKLASLSVVLCVPERDSEKTHIIWFGISRARSYTTQSSCHKYTITRLGELRSLATDIAATILIRWLNRLRNEHLYALASPAESPSAHAVLHQGDRLFLSDSICITIQEAGYLAAATGNGSRVGLIQQSNSCSLGTSAGAGVANGWASTRLRRRRRRRQPRTLIVSRPGSERHRAAGGGQSVPVALIQTVASFADSAKWDSSGRREPTRRDSHA